MWAVNTAGTCEITVLNLASETPTTWLDRMVPHMDLILIDHAHCEKKAASMAINLIFRYQDKRAMLEPLSALAREELEHFELVLQTLEERGIPFVPQEQSPYGKKLFKAVRKTEPDRLLDTLLICSLIEARSCERMKLLAENLEDAELASFYRELLACEARHHHGYVEIALNYFPRDVVWPRLKELARHEAAVIEDAPDVPRLHN